jgi:inward rectifier potassium channel
MKSKRFTPAFLRSDNTISNEGESDLGFGSKIAEGGGRLINKDGSFNIFRMGIRHWAPYEWLVEMSWPFFFLFVFVFFCMANTIFAGLFMMLGIETLNGAGHTTFLEDFANAFFFSVQTFTTVGYGAITPKGWAANIVASADALVGLMAFALVTGLFFSRFAKPKARIVFSRKALIAPYQDGTSFQFRIANKRNNKLINLAAKLSISWVEEKEGKRHRRFAALPLERDTIALLPLNWTIVHPIHESSPLFEKSAEDLKAMKAEFLVLIEGYDETFAQMVHTSSSYMTDELVYHVRFKPMYYPNEEHTILRLDWIDDVESQ